MLKVTIGAVGAVPVPVSGMDCGDPLASSVTLKAPVLVPVAVGVNVTLIVQDKVDASVGPHDEAEIA